MPRYRRWLVGLDMTSPPPPRLYQLVQAHGWRILTAAGGTRSRIVATLAPGAGVVTTRAHVRTVVTEWGVAELFGKSLRERAEALIGIAHPDFRAELVDAAARAHTRQPRPGVGSS